VRLLMARTIIKRAVESLVASGLLKQLEDELHVAHEEMLEQGKI